jgi:outer membrane protein TolC
LQNERSFVQLEGQQLIAQVGLIKALGGGWENKPENGALAAKTR